MTKLFKRVCKTCGRKFFCDFNCGRSKKEDEIGHCECCFCHARTVNEKGHSCEERVERKYGKKIKAFRKDFWNPSRRDDWEDEFKHEPDADAIH